MKRIVFAAVAIAVVMGSVGVGEAAKKKKPPVDRTPPVVRFSTGPNAIMTSFYFKDQVQGTVLDRGQYGSGEKVKGVVDDNLSGVNTVRVTFKYCTVNDFDLGRSTNRTATCSTAVYDNPAVIRCADACIYDLGASQVGCNAKRLHCVWEVNVPLYPGVYVVKVEARDKKNNLGRATPINILVVPMFKQCSGQAC